VCEGNVHETTPTVVAKEDIVDLNGAGDSFCGGLMAALMKGKSIEEAAQAGHYVATVTIQTSGTSFEGKKPDYAL
jgi:adenosine kinase